MMSKRVWAICKWPTYKNIKDANLDLERKTKIALQLWHQWIVVRRKMIEFPQCSSYKVQERRALDWYRKYHYAKEAVAEQRVDFIEGGSEA